ncbi:PREDICTED: odorant receptor 49b-like [Dufourea novaeangliae]|uniref:odorant receptor 49b-like n=1 Tax=Dufourea novaeangliae TaxID=178035 RepID=UPI000767219E|nr:PREDICTED: odorant receptor 49b-like [Dufourea novaeangliae]
MNLDLNIVDVLMYTACTLLQIFYYSWYGNEVKLKSLEVPGIVFESDWMFLSNSSKKSLLIIMQRASVPIEFTCVHLLSMNLDSFKALLKTSYSAFNLLQQTR